MRWSRSISLSRRRLGIWNEGAARNALVGALAPRVAPDDAAALSAAMLRDALLLAGQLTDCDVFLLGTGARDLEPLRVPAPGGAPCASEPEAESPHTLSQSVGELVAGDANIVVMSWNAPGLTVDCVQRAFDLLESGEAGVVIGPAERGGAYLVGLSSRQRGLLSALDDWFGESIESVCERFAGQRVAMLSPWDVVDDWSSLGRLIDALGRDGRRLAPATRAALRRLWERGAPVPPLSQPWEVIASRDLYTSPWRDFIVDTLRTHRGEVIDYARIATPDAVWTVPVTSDGAIVLIHQYRLPVRDWLLEVPAGSIAAGMGEGRLEQAAARELREEIGGLAASLQYQGAFYSSAGQLSLRAHVFLALDVTLDEPELETTELLVPVHVPAELAFEMARRGEIGDGQSALALLMCEAAIRSHLGRD